MSSNNSDDILRELKKITKIMILSNADRLENELSKHATTNDRKKIWVLLDSKKQSNEIAQFLGVTKRAVDIFLKTLEDAELIEREFNKPPRRILDYIPPQWILLLPEVKIAETQTTESKNPEVSENGS